MYKCIFSFFLQKCALLYANVSFIFLDRIEIALAGCTLTGPSRLDSLPIDYASTAGITGRERKYLTKGVVFSNVYKYRNRTTRAFLKNTL